MHPEQVFGIMQDLIIVVTVDYISTQFLGLPRVQYTSMIWLRW